MRYDLTLMDVDARRAKRRKKWLLYSLLPIIIVFCVGIKLIMPSISAHFVKSAYESGNLDAAKIWVQMSLFANFLEPYIAHFNDGTITYAQGEYTDAEDKFNLALQNNPPEDRRCDVRVNLSLSIEAQADGLITSKSYDEAIVTYDRAKAVLYGDNCVDPVEDSGKSEKALESRKRLDEKQEEAVRMRNNDSPAEDDGDGQSDPQNQNNSTPTSQSQMQELQQQLEDAMKYRKHGQRTTRGWDTSDNNYGSEGKTW